MRERSSASSTPIRRRSQRAGAPAHEPGGPTAISELMMWLERAERIRTQQRHDKNKLYALHAPEVEPTVLSFNGGK